MVSLKKNKKMRKTQRLTESDIRRIVRKATKKDKLMVETLVEDPTSTYLITFAVLAGFGLIGRAIRKKIISALRAKGKNDIADRMEKKMNDNWKFNPGYKRKDTGGDIGDVDF